MQTHWPDSGAAAPPEPDPGFAADLRRALSVWRSHPLLPVSTVVLAALESISSPDAVIFIGMAALLFNGGFIGTQRIWYLRAFREQRIASNEIWRLTWRFVPRFVVLAIVIVVPLSGLFAGLAYVLWSGRSEISTFEVMLVLTPIVTVIDVLLTFVTPALSYTTRSVRTALREGLRMLRSEWPGCLWYALAPPLAAGVVGFGSLESVVGPAAAAVIALTAGNLLNLWFKGAIALFYLRRNPWVPDDGSARS